MRFLIDESTGALVASYLRQTGHDVLTVAEIAYQAEDINILKWAVEDSRIVITNDKDFGDLVFVYGQKHSGIVLLRLQDESPANKVAVVTAVMESYANRLVDNFTVARETNIRVHEQHAIETELSEDKDI